MLQLGYIADKGKYEKALYNRLGRIKSIDRPIDSKNFTMDR